MKAKEVEIKEIGDEEDRICLGSGVGGKGGIGRAWKVWAGK